MDRCICGHARMDHIEDAMTKIAWCGYCRRCEYTPVRLPEPEWVRRMRAGQLRAKVLGGGPAL